MSEEVVSNRIVFTRLTMFQTPKSWAHLREQSQPETSRSTAGSGPEWIDVWFGPGRLCGSGDSQLSSGLCRLKKKVKTISEDSSSQDVLPRQNLLSFHTHNMRLLTCWIFEAGVGHSLQQKTKRLIKINVRLFPWSIWTWGQKQPHYFPCFREAFMYSEADFG